jgi:hypothetical protein
VPTSIAARTVHTFLDTPVKTVVGKIHVFEKTLRALRRGPRRKTLDRLLFTCTDWRPAVSMGDLGVHPRDAEKREGS